MKTNQTNNQGSVDELVEEFERLEEMCDDDSDQMVAMYRRNLRQTLTEAQEKAIADYQTNYEQKHIAEAVKLARDEAVERIKKLQKWADTDGGEAGMREDEYGGWLDRDEVLEVLQDK